MAAKRKYNVKGTKDFIFLAGIFFFFFLWAVKDAWYPSPKVLEKHPLEVSISFETSGMLRHLYVAEGDSIGESQVLAELRRVEKEEEFEVSKKAYSAAKDEYTLADEALRNAVKNGASGEEIAVLKQNQIDAQAAMASTLEQVNTMRARIDATALQAPIKGVVQSVLVSVHEQVKVIEAESEGKISRIENGVLTVEDSEGASKDYAIYKDMLLKVNSGDTISKGDIIASQIAFVIDPADHFYLFNKSLSILSFIAFWGFLGIHILTR